MVLKHSPEFLGKKNQECKIDMISLQSSKVIPDPFCTLIAARFQLLKLTSLISFLSLQKFIEY